MSVIRSALDKSWPLGSGFSRKPSFADDMAESNCDRVGRHCRQQNQSGQADR